MNFEALIDPDPRLTEIMRLGKKLTLASDYLLRKEEFGGILFDKNSLSPLKCNDSAFVILNYFKKFEGLKLREGIALVKRGLRRRFVEIPDNIDIILSVFISICLKHKFLRTKR